MMTKVSFVCALIGAYFCVGGKAVGADQSVATASGDGHILASPFSRDGTAILLHAPADRNGRLEWASDSVVPGKRYSLSFFFQNRVIRSPQNEDYFSVLIFDHGTPIFEQRLGNKNFPQFYATDVVFGTSYARIVIEVPKGNEIVFGEFGRAVDVNDLADTKYANGSTLWMPKLQLPAVYRGLRKFEVGLHLQGKKTSDLLTLENVSVRARMNVAAAKLPVLIPGKNELNIRFDSAGAGALIQLGVTPREISGEVTLRVSHDKKIPADGATFGRVFVSAVNDQSELVSGAYFRLKAPPAIKVYPYTKAIAEWRKLQTVREFHLTALQPGDYEVGIDQWNGAAWVDTGRKFVVTFEPTDQAAPDFVRSSLTRRWLEPVAEAGTETEFGRKDIVLTDLAKAQVEAIKVRSPLSPIFDWRITGPVARLGLYNSFQPDPRSLAETARSLWSMVSAGSANRERDYALGVEEYVGLLMEGYLPAAFCELDYPSFGRLHREGRGWCWEYAAATHALVIEGGLESRLLNVPNHVTGEVRGEQLAPMMIDSMLQVAVTDALGNRLELGRAGDEGTRVRGAGVLENTRRTSYSGYLQKPLKPEIPWERRDEADAAYRTKYADSEVFAINLFPWEQLHWRSGSISEFEEDVSRGSCAENQTVVTKTSVLNFHQEVTHPQIEFDRFERNKLGQLVPMKFGDSYLTFPFECPVEVEDLMVTTSGTMGVGDMVKIMLRPVLNEPLIIGEGELESSR